ncbi:MAG: TonB-dependent receptor [Sphingomicrobium sp.]
MPALPPPLTTAPIVITASRAPVAQADSAASVAIIDGTLIVRLDEPLIGPLLRLTPSAAVSTSGPAGSLTDVRFRGAEANHSLLFVDGIRINDPASGDIPRFELVNSGIASRIEVVRGPQSALWGSDAIGGVVAVNGIADAPGLAASAEAGSFASRRASASGATAWTSGELAGALAVQRASGIDSFGSPGGDRDGNRNLSGRLRGVIRPAANVELGLAAVALTGRSEYDGYDLTTFEHADTLDSSRNRLGAARLWVAAGHNSSPWRGQLSASILGSTNRNLLDGELLNRTRGSRQTIEAQVERHLITGVVDHRLILAGESDRETFDARDLLYGGATDQDRSRAHRAVTAEWRADAKVVKLDVALRRDVFTRFKDATTVRAGAVVPLAEGFALAASYGQGIAPPTFFDLYGFFPGNFVGNPSLKPERSLGFEAGLRYAKGPLSASIIGYRQRLSDEIVDVFDPVTFLQSSENRSGKSRRSGIEVEAGWSPGERLRLSGNYAFLDADQPDGGGGRIVELRRPRHSGSLVADGALGRWRYGTSLAFVGAHRDVRDSFPYDTVRLARYWLADARVAYQLKLGIELFARGSNLLDSTYQDTAGYRTEGRGLFAGIRLADRRSSR